MWSSDYLTADLCLRAQRDNLLGKLRWSPAKAICNTHFVSEQRSERGKQASNGVTMHVFTTK